MRSRAVSDGRREECGEPSGHIYLERTEKIFCLLSSVSGHGSVSISVLLCLLDSCLCPSSRPLGPQPLQEVWVGGVLCHPSVISTSPDGRMLVGGRGGRGWIGDCWEPRASSLVPSSPSSHLPLGTTKWPSAEGPRGCWWGNMGLYCEA